MSKHDFTIEEFSSRLARTREAIGAAGLDWLLVFHPSSIHWLTGSDAKSYQEFQCLFVAAREEPLLIFTREGERNEFRDDALVDEIHTHGGGKAEDPIVAFEKLAKVLFRPQDRIGMEVPAYYLHPHHYVRIGKLLGEALAGDFTHLIPQLKFVKSPTELNYIRKASQLADAAMQVFADALQPGISELELAGEIYYSLLSSGSGFAASPINLVSGERSCFSHGAPTQRILKSGDCGNVEFGATCKRYTATIGRQFCLGESSTRLQEIYNVVRAACDTCIAHIHPGVSANAAHNAAQKIIEDAGLEAGRVHLSGYSLAAGSPPSWAEPFFLLDDNAQPFQHNMVVTVEPPVFLGEEYLGARIIDNVQVTENGAKVLSYFSRDIIQK